MIEALYKSADAPDGGVIVDNNSSARPIWLYIARGPNGATGLRCSARSRSSVIGLIENGQSNLSLGTLEIASRKPWQSLEKQFVLTQFTHLYLGGAYIAAGENPHCYGC